MLSLLPNVSLFSNGKTYGSPTTPLTHGPKSYVPYLRPDAPTGPYGPKLSGKLALARNHEYHETRDPEPGGRKFHQR